MSAVIIVFEFLILGVLCFWLLHHYASLKKTPWYALASTWFGWLLCFSIVFLIPIDILNMDYDDCEAKYEKWEHDTHDPNVTLDSSYYDSDGNIIPMWGCNRPITSVPDSYMKHQWAALWWGTMILSWLGFPLLSSFFQAAHFSIWERDKFLALMLSLANAYGLVLTVILMGYGLVDIPRYLWRKADRTATLRYYCVMAFKYKEGIEQAKGDLLKTLKVVKTIADRVNDHDPYRPFVDVILSKCPPDFGEVSGEGSVELTYSKLVSVHQKVIEDTHNVARAVCLYEQMLKKAFKTEDVMRTRTHKQSDWKIYWSFIPARTGKFAKVLDVWEYLWQVYLFTTGLRIFSLFFALLSILIVWSEITLTASILLFHQHSHKVYDLTTQEANLSPFAHMLTGLHIQGFAKQLYCLLVIFYMALCAYTTLFKIKIFNFYRLVPHQMSDGGSIMFSANYLCRLAAPLAYNFLTLVNVNDTNFTDVMGDMATSGLGNDFMIGFPVLVVVLCLAALFNVYSKIGAICCIKRLRYRPDNDELLIDAGEKILAEARETKEGRGAVQMTTKETIKSSIREEVREVSKLAHNKSENGLYEKEQTLQMQQDPIVLPPIPEATPAPPANLYDAMAAKYGIQRQGGELLPPTSRFAKRKNSLDPTAPPPTGMRQNLSANDLAEAEAGSIPRNLSNNTLNTPAAPTSTFSKFFKPNFSSSASNLPTLPTTSAPTRAPIPSFNAPSINVDPPSSPSLPVPPLPVRSKPSSSFDLPSTSRFAQKSPNPTPAAAIIVSPPPSDSDSASLNPSSSSRRDTSALLGGLFGRSNK